MTTGGSSLGERALARVDALHVVRIRALESTFRLETADGEIAERLRVEWSRCLVDEPDPNETTLSVERRGRSRDGVTYALASDITRRAIEAQIGRRLMFHACGLVDDAGRTAVLVAPSGTGKTTAAATLARKDFGYLTDEAVVVDDDGRVTPYPKPLSIVKPEGGKAQAGPDELGLRPCPPEPRIRALVLLDRVREGAVEPRLEPVPLLEAMLELLPQTSALPSLERPIQRLCEAIDRCGGVYRLTYAQIDEVKALVRDLLEAPPRPAESWSALAVAAAIQQAAVLDPTRAILRTTVRDAVRVGDEALLLRGVQPVRLSGIGLTIWREAHTSTGLPDLAEATVREHGPHPEAEALVRDAVRAMVESGVLGQADRGV